MGFWGFGEFKIGQTPHKQQIKAVAFSKNGRTFVSASNDLIAVWALSKDSAELKF